MWKSDEELAESTKRLMPDRVSTRHRALMRRLLAGMTPGEAARELGYSLTRVSLIIRSPLFRAEMENMQREINEKFTDREGKEIHQDVVRERLKRASEKAARTLEGALDDDSGRVRLSAAKEILDRTGYAKKEQVEGGFVVEPSEGFVNLLERIFKANGEKEIDESAESSGGEAGADTDENSG